MLDGALDRVVTLLQTTTKPVKVVAIDGHSAAGKSTFAARLAERTPAAVVPGDDFYSVMDEDERAALSPPDGAARYYDWRRLRDEALLHLRNGQPSQYRPYVWTTNSLAEDPVTIEPKPAVIVEGLFVSRPELSGLVDLTVLVCADINTRRKRQLDRQDATPSWLERWDAAERWYFEHLRRPDSFDVVAAEDATP